MKKIFLTILSLAFVFSFLTAEKVEAREDWRFLASIPSNLNIQVSINSHFGILTKLSLNLLSPRNQFENLKSPTLKKDNSYIREDFINDLKTKKRSSSLSKGLELNRTETLQENFSADDPISQYKGIFSKKGAWYGNKVSFKVRGSGEFNVAYLHANGDWSYRGTRNQLTSNWQTFSFEIDPGTYVVDFQIMLFNTDSNSAEIEISENGLKPMRAE